MSNESFNTYWKKIFLLNNFFEKLLLKNREEIFKIFEKKVDYNDNMTLLDVGTTASRSKVHNIILQKTANNRNIVCYSNQDCSNLKQDYKNISKIVIGDGTKIEYDNNSFDIVHSSATIEHVGSEERQIQLIKECLRVSKNTVFITTPNRFYPIDFHTKLPLIHLLPKSIHRRLLKLLGLGFFAKEENLNLMDKNQIIRICKKLKIENFKIISHKFLFMTSNFIIIINKS